MKLTNDQFKYLLEQLSKASLISDQERERRYALNNAWKRIDAKEDYAEMKVTHYDTSNLELISILNKISGGRTKDVVSLHTVEYFSNNFLRSHLDTSCRLTLNILLESNCKGGDLFIEGKKAELNNPGDYVLYDGGTQFHEVKPIEEGYRKTLIIWYSTPLSNDELI